MRGQVKLNTAPSKLATLARRLARGLAKIPKPAPIYVVVGRMGPIAAYRSRKLAEEAAEWIRATGIGAVLIATVPVRG
jgi:hypothetical protein